MCEAVAFATAADRHELEAASRPNGGVPNLAEEREKMSETTPGRTAALAPGYSSEVCDPMWQTAEAQG